MSTAFAWLNEVIHFLGSLIPRLLIVRATAGGVKWVHGSTVKRLGPGLHLYWPIVTEVETCITARQTLDIANQTLTTKDGRHVTVSAVAVYRIADVVAAIGEKNYDIYDTCADLAQAAIVRMVTNKTFDDLREMKACEMEMTRAVARAVRDYGIEIERVAFTNFAECRVYRLIQGPCETRTM